MDWSEFQLTLTGKWGVGLRQGLTKSREVPLKLHAPSRHHQPSHYSRIRSVEYRKGIGVTDQGILCLVPSKPSPRERIPSYIGSIFVPSYIEISLVRLLHRPTTSFHLYFLNTHKRKSKLVGILDGLNTRKVSYSVVSRSI